MSLILDGSAGVTFPNSTVQASSGVVLQVVNATFSTESGTSSTSFVATGLAGTITPKFANSKILATFNVTTYQSTGVNCWITLYRGTTSGKNLGNGINGLGAGYVASSGSKGNVGSTVLDSPATTSAQVYTLAFRADSGTQYICSENSTATLTLMEIAG